MKFLEKSFQTGNFYLELYVKGAKGCGAMKCSEARELLSPYLDNQITTREKQLLEKAFAKYKTTRKIAKELGINQSTVVRKAAKYGLGAHRTAVNT